MPIPFPVRECPHGYAHQVRQPGWRARRPPIGVIYDLPPCRSSYAGSTADSTGPTSMIINIHAGPYGFTGVHPCETGPAPLCPSHPLRKSTGSATLSGFRFHPSSFSPHLTHFELFRPISTSFSCGRNPNVRPARLGNLRKPMETHGNSLKLRTAPDSRIQIGPGPLWSEAGKPAEVAHRGRSRFGVLG